MGWRKNKLIDRLKDHFNTGNIHCKGDPRYYKGLLFLVIEPTPPSVTQPHEFNAK